MTSNISSSSGAFDLTIFGSSVACTDVDLALCIVTMVLLPVLVFMISQNFSLIKEKTWLCAGLYPFFILVANEIFHDIAHETFQDAFKEPINTYAIYYLPAAALVFMLILYGMWKCCAGGCCIGWFLPMFIVFYTFSRLSLGFAILILMAGVVILLVFRRTLTKTLIGGGTILAYAVTQTVVLSSLMFPGHERLPGCIDDGRNRLLVCNENCAFLGHSVGDSMIHMGTALVLVVVPYMILIYIAARYYPVEATPRTLNELSKRFERTVATV
jgi:hypothetical protein